MKHFLNDRDGMTAKDYMLVISTTIFFLFISVGLILITLGTGLDPMYLDLVDTVKPVIITITSGIFGVKAVETFSSGRIKEKQYERESQPEPPEDFENRI